MSEKVLEIKSINVNIGEKNILRDLSLSVNKGEIHAIMGKNGKGKSTLFSAIIGNPVMELTAGDILFEGESIIDESPDERARRGIFLSFQSAIEIPGVSLSDFIRTAMNATREENINVYTFAAKLKKTMQLLNIDPSHAFRDLNVGFSGGEKKKAEILQLLMLEPKLALLDETDSGLDFDAIDTVANNIRNYKNSENSVIIITHSTKLLERLDADFVHILDNGKIIKTGGKELAKEIVENGFTNIDNM